MSSSKLLLLDLHTEFSGGWSSGLVFPSLEEFPTVCWAQMVKASVYNVGDLASIPGSGRSAGEGSGNPLQYYYLENPMDTGAWWAKVHGVSESDTTEVT